MTLLPCISIHQPWASLIAHGIKKTEGRTHTRFASLVGKRVAIHATKTWDREWRGKVPKHALLETVAPWFERQSGRTWDDLLGGDCNDFLIRTFPMGAIAATAIMEKVICVRRPPLNDSGDESWDLERHLVGLEREQLTDVLLGDVLYRMEDVRRLATPIPAKGKQGVWFVEVPA